MPLAPEAGETEVISTPLEAFSQMRRNLAALVPVAFVAVNCTKNDDPLVVGVPDIWPVELLKFSPVGSADSNVNEVG